MEKEKIGHIIPSIAVCTASPVYDCCRYVTGTLASLGYSSYCITRGVSVEWSSCNAAQRYVGGYVMKPTRGLHENLFVCDFKSMYPTIMASCNINPHSFTVEKDEEGMRESEVNVSKSATRVRLGERTVCFDNRNSSTMSWFIRFLVEERDSSRKTMPIYAKSLKVLSNSVDGSLGYSDSILYSPACTASVTAVGRYYVILFRKFFMNSGLEVVYGDTDSCMITGEASREQISKKVEDTLMLLHSHMETTSIYMMRMDIEECYQKGIMTDKKRYCMLLSDGSTKKVGISLSRKDVSGLCRVAAEVTIEAIFNSDRHSATNRIAEFLCAVSQMAIQGSFTLSDISRYVKKDGVSCYSYPEVDGGTKYIPQDEAVMDSVVLCDMSKVLRSVAAEIERYTVPCKMGLVLDITRAATF